MKAGMLQINDKFICRASGWFHPQKELGISPGQVLIVKKWILVGDKKILATIIETGKEIEIPFHCLVLKLIM